MYNKGILLHTSAKRYRPSGYDTRGSLYKANSGDLQDTTGQTPPRFRDEKEDDVLQASLGFVV